MRYCSERLKARTVSQNISDTDHGARAMIWWSPCVPQRACITSPWAGRVGRPVHGPPRITLTTTTGISRMHAAPRFSCISENPGPLVAVMDFTPATEAPTIAPMLAISSSIWMKRPPNWGRRAAISSAISVEGVIG